MDGDTSRDSRGFWTRRKMAGAAIGIGLIAATLTANVSAAMNQRTPALALAFWPYDARATLRVAAATMRNESAPPPAIVAARQAIARDPSLPLAFVLLALDPRALQSRRDEALAYSRILSRRDQGTTFLLLQNALKRNQVPAFFDNFDIAMRTSNRAAETLVPVVIKAMVDDRIVVGLGNLLARKPVWGREFLLSVINDAPTADKAARLVDAARRAGVRVEPDRIAILVNRLIAEGAFAPAARFYEQTFPDRSGALVRSFAPTSPTTTGFDWVLANGSDLWGEVDDQPKGAPLRYFANAGASGVVARQFALIQPGRYRFAFRSSARGGSVFKTRWTISCGDSDILAEADASKSGVVTFEVPATCPAVEFVLAAAADLNVAENEGTVEGFALTRIG